MMKCSSRRRTQEASPPLSDSSVTLKSSSSAIFDDGMLTPPEECLRRKVSFDIVDSSESEPEYVDSSHQILTVLPPPPPISASPDAQSLLDLCATRVSQEILVGLFDRPAEMKDLLSRNAGFFGILRDFVSKADGDWKKFLAWIFIDRDVVGDLEWIDGVGAFLSICPAYFEKFKEIVGYDEDSVEGSEDDDNQEEDDCYYNTNDNDGHKNHNRNSDDDDDNDDRDVGNEDGYDADNADDSDDDDDDEYDDEERPYDNNFENVDLTLIRRFPARLSSFERSYPQFFINARDCLCRPRSPHGMLVESKKVNPSGRVEQIVCTAEEREQPYREFAKVLFSPRRVLPDDEWERTLLECLEGWPNLLAQLKEIVAFEVEDSWGEE